MGRRTPTPIGYKGRFRTMDDIYREYRNTPLNRGAYKAYFESRPSYGGYQKKSRKTEYSREPLHSFNSGERENIEQTPKTQSTYQQPEPKTENTEQSGPRQLPIVELMGKQFFFDEKLQEIRDMENPANSISFKDLDLAPEKTEQRDQLEKQNDIQYNNDLTRLENELEVRQTDIIQQKRPSQYEDKIETRW